MQESNRIVYWGFIISFLGSLPPGVMNLLGTSIYDQLGAGPAMAYIAGFMLVEMVLVRLVLLATNWLIRSIRLFRLMEWLTAAFLLGLALSSFLLNGYGDHAIVNVEGGWKAGFAKGALLSLLNPMHIPFWLGWSSFLLNKGVLKHGHIYYLKYIGGIAIGTFAGVFCFILAGTAIFQQFHNSQNLINCVIGCFLFIAALLHIRKLLTVPLAVRQAQMLKQS